MSTATTASSPPKSPASLSIVKDPDAIRRTVLEVLQGETESAIDPEQLPNSFGRVPLEIAFRVLPVAFDGTHVLWDNGESDSVLALTRDLSCDGMAFEHCAVFEGPHFVAFFPSLTTAKLALLFERLWSRELQPAEFLSGGRFLGVVSLQEPKRVPRSK
jgi:hypothetical protein